MNLVQKLPIGLGLACLMMMTSCSKEGVQTPEPVKSEKTNASMREESLILTYAHYFAPTIGQTGLEVYPVDWSRSSHPGGPSVATLPAGVSNRTHSLGKVGVANQWVKPLSAIPFRSGANSFVTITTKTSDYNVSERIDGIAKIKGLIVGEKYSIEFYVATTALSGPLNGYAKEVIAQVDFPYNPIKIDLAGKKAEWVKRTIEFKAWSKETTFTFAAASENNAFAFAHIYVDQNSIKKVL